MKIQTYSIIVGSEECNAYCPYCVSKMTPRLGISYKKPKINWRNFAIGSEFAKDSGVSTVLITGKGEPTLFSEQITECLIHLKPFTFPFIELQTNGIKFGQEYNKQKALLKKWYDLGMATIAISVVHYDNKKNKEIFQPQESYMDLVDLIKKLHGLSFSVRLTCVMLRGFIDSTGEVKKLVEFAKENQVEQVSIRTTEIPEKSRNPKVYNWTTKHQLSQKQLSQIRRFLDKQATELMRLVHGAIVYDLDGQNICLTNALTIDPRSEEVRQLIFFPDGHLRYDWQYKGAILL